MIRSIFKKEGLLPITVAAVVSVFLVVSYAGATTTISTDISTGGALSVTGLSTLTAGYVAQASSTVTGAFTVSGGAAFFNGAVAATSTLQVTGAVTTYGTVTNKGAVTNTSTLTQGSAGTAMTAIQFGFCNLQGMVVVASSTNNYTTCTSAGTIDNTYRVFVSATSTLSGVSIVAASSTASSGTISVQLNGGTAGATLGTLSLNFWAVK